MSTVTSTSFLSAPPGGWTVEDLSCFPDDGLRYELVDGVLLVSAAPSEEHQIVLVNLLVLLRQHCPEHLRVLPAPFDVRFSPVRQLQPDIVVLPRDRQAASRRPVLVVEVLSPSTRATDTTLKRHVFEQAGITSYWLVDAAAPSLTALELRDGFYTDLAVVRGDECLAAALPFPMSVVPNDLLR